MKGRTENKTILINKGTIRGRGLDVFGLFEHTGEETFEFHYNSGDLDPLSINVPGETLVLGGALNIISVPKETA